ncbi:plasmid pRiA4b ORF-3 family protein [Corynebacterium sanguinis]|uniref:plasmid pRiA4b ORF-3 family protein n=1 Tax=Corynebacterium sanguinis TaxID=2594913 RepID=UPI00223A8A1F|nr:plasmid pRiA4b ORF-3 family protein [Corynebacterium sanguinis]MCT1585479.1 plasmid pRiA4b ORF-3 family protein [Corynebacterium sanguinis]
MFDLTLLRPRSGSRSTFMLRVSVNVGDEEAYRYLGIAEASSLHDVSRAVATAFGLSAQPAGFTTEPAEPRPDTVLDPATTLGDAFTGARTTIYYHWGLWRFDLELVEAYPRDDATPPAVCVAGSGAFGAAELSITEINRDLIGEDFAADVLKLTRAEVRDVVARTSMYDFVLLLKALDLGRETDLPASVRASISKLPRERTAAGRDAFWSVILALACFADAETTDNIITSTYASLGHPALPAQQVREKCAGSLVRLTASGAYGSSKAAPVERLDTFRALLRG